MDTLAQIDDKHLLLFDGACNLCNGAVNFIIDRDCHNKFVFASLQSPLGQEVAEKYNLPIRGFTTMVLIKNGKLYLRSNATLEIARYLSSAWPLLYAFKIVPIIIRDAFYHIISANRYNWFGKKDQCRLPAPDVEKSLCQFDCRIKTSDVK